MVCPSCRAENAPDVEVCLNCGRHLTALTLGMTIASRYDVLGLLGKGGMGMVYKAHDRLLDELVAIKVLRSELMSTPDMAQRFRSELKLARKVSHPNVCRIHEYGEDGALSYISMALIEGTDLRQILQQHPEGLPREEAFQVSLQVAAGLQAIHDAGVIHRDLKTPNIVRDASGLVRLMDFGIAKETGGSGGVTGTGQVMGTPEYMSPEQCRGKTLDFRSDIYSLGIVVFEIFTGRVPFRGDSVMSTLMKQLEEPPPVEKARLPAALLPVLRKALAKDPAARYASATEMAEALRQAQQQREEALIDDVSPTTGLDGPPSERRRDSRLDISVDMMLRRTGAGGSVLQEERTVADNVGLHGARVMTGMTSVSVGDTVSVQEVGGDFQARSAVRHVSTGKDQIRKLGVEFLDRTAPGRWVPTDESHPRIPRPPTPASGSPPRTPAPVAPPAPVSTPPADRRNDSRLEISLDVFLRKLGPEGAVLREERTVADNVGRRGARVMTSMTELVVGDVVILQEVAGPFQTRAAVRNAYPGKDGIPRIGVEFLDRPAPDHLIPDSGSKPRVTSARTPLPEVPRKESHTPAPPPTATGPEAEAARERRREILAAYEGLKTRNHFEVLGLPRASNAAQVKDAYFQLSRQFHPDAALAPELADLKPQIQAVFVRLSEAYQVLTDPGRRSSYEERLGPSGVVPRKAEPPAPPAPAAVATPPPQAPRPAPAAPPEPPRAKDPESQAELAEVALRDARRLLAREKNWDAVQTLEGALGLAKGSKVNRAVRTLLGRAVAKNPKWLKRAEEILAEVVHEDPLDVEAQLALGNVYKAAGLKARARATFRRVLELDPRHPEAAAALSSLGPSTDDSAGHSS